MGVAARTERISDVLPERSGRADAVAIGLLAFVIGICGANRPSLWLDEAATISASTRPLPDLANLLGHVDAVHGVHYVLMHAWFTVFPATEFWARVPSSLLVGGAAAGVVVLGRQLSVRSVAVAAGIVFAVLPRTTWAAIEARSYALSMFDAVWVTVLCVVAVRRDRTWPWIAYAIGLALTVVANVFVILVVAVHLVLIRRLTDSRRIAARWLAAAIAAGGAVLPFVILTGSQQGQVDWIPAIGQGTLGQLLGDQYFPAVITVGSQTQGESVPRGIPPEVVAASLRAWALIAPLIIVLLVVIVVTLRTRRRQPVLPGARLLVTVASAWIALPTAGVIAVSLVGEPVYQPHYLAFTVPGVALLLGWCVVVVGRAPRGIAAVLAVIAMAAVPNCVAQRGPYSKFGRDQSQVADLIEARAATGDCLNVDDAAPAKLVEPLTAGRPAAFARLRDPGLRQSAVDRGELFESRRPIREWADELRTCPALWTVTARGAADSVHEVPVAAGFRLTDRWTLNTTEVLRYAPGVEPP